VRAHPPPASSCARHCVNLRVAGHSCWQAEGARAQLDPVVVSIFFQADGPGRQLDGAVVEERRELHRTRGCLLRPGAARHLHTDASMRRAFAATSAGRQAALQRPERKVQCQVSNILQPACAIARQKALASQSKGTSACK